MKITKLSYRNWCVTDDAGTVLLSGCVTEEEARKEGKAAMQRAEEAKKPEKQAKTGLP